MKNLSRVFAGLVLLFLLSDCGKERPSPRPYQPIMVSLVEYSNLTTTSVNIRGTISGGPEDITGRGVCWATHNQASISDNKTSDGAGMGRFESFITGLSPNTRYYIRLYAESTKDTVYSSEIAVTTAFALPVVETKMMTNVFTYDARATGVVADGAPGFCWSTSPNPTVNDNVINLRLPKYQTSGEFEGLMSELSPNTTYYLKAFAVNRAGTAYGNQITFTTNSEAVPAQDYLPLQVGNYWELSDGKYSSSILIDNTEKLNGIDYFRLVRKNNPSLWGGTDTVYVRKTSNGIVYQRFKTSTLEPPLFYLAAVTGEVWFEWPHQSYPQYGKLSNKTDSVKRNGVVFTDCFRFEYYPGVYTGGSSTVEWDYWLAPNLGFVKFLPQLPLLGPARRLIKSRINGIEQTY